MPVSKVDAPPALMNLPHRPRLFVGRCAEMGQLDRALAEPGTVVVQAVHGLGGIGKSTLVAHWVAEHATQHTLTWWITAETSSSIDAGLANLARALQPALGGVLPAEALRERAVQWLASHHGWLVVLDNVSDPTDIAPLLAAAPTGRYLITSRRASGWHSLAQPIHLDVLSPTEAVNLLTEIVAPSTPQELMGASELCAELGFLPLAIEQAGAFIAQAGISPPDYLVLLRDHPAEMYRATAEGGDVARTVARIWHITLDRLADEPLTGEVLRFLAWYAPDAIPRSLLDSFATPPELISAIGRLAAYSMLSADPATVAVHRLVQAVARTPEPGDPHRDSKAIAIAREQATAHLAAAIPDNNPVEWPTWRTLLPHINAFADHAPSGTDTEITAQLFHEVGMFLLGQGQVSQAAAYLQRAIDGIRQAVGDDHADVLTALNNLGCAYIESGNLGQAIAILGQNLIDQRRILGNDHEDTLRSCNNLARAHMDAGHLAQAIPMFEQNLADRRRVLGNDHEDTLTSRNNLARAYQIAKDIERAISMFEQNLPELDRVMGSDHPRTLTARNNLAAAYLYTEDPARAIPLFEHNLIDQQRILGNDHPDTLDCRNDLARAVQLAGHPDQAIPMFEQNLVDRERVLGPDHPKVLASHNNIARAYEAAKNFDKAISLFKKNLAELHRILGNDHPQTLAGYYSLGGAYLESGDLASAARLYKRCLTDQQRVLGNDHPNTLDTRNNLAQTYLEAGNPRRSIPLFEQNLADQQRVLGEDHIETLSSRHSLARAHFDAGHIEQALDLFEQSCAELSRILGRSHPSTLACRSNLAYTYLKSGKKSQAISLFEQTLADQQRVLGSNHPDTLTTRRNLATAQRSRNLRPLS